MKFDFSPDRVLLQQCLRRYKRLQHFVERTVENSSEVWSNLPLEQQDEINSIIVSLEGLQNAHEVSVATEAAYVVACIYDGGQGCERSPSRAAHLYARAAKDGVEAVRNAALYNLATLTLAGADGIQKDPKLAFLMYETAALAGHANAAYNVASLLGNGEGVARDFAGAKKWFSIAASRGHSGALKQEAFLSRRNFVSTVLVFASAMALAIVTCVVLISSFA